MRWAAAAASSSNTTTPLSICCCWFFHCRLSFGADVLCVKQTVWCGPRNEWTNKKERAHTIKQMKCSRKNHANIITISQHLNKSQVARSMKQIRCIIQLAFVHNYAHFFCEKLCTSLKQFTFFVSYFIVLPSIKMWIFEISAIQLKCRLFLALHSFCSLFFFTCFSVYSDYCFSFVFTFIELIIIIIYFFFFWKNSQIFFI